ncbi:MAG: DNA primase [Halobacteriovoraceae bacterium]|nr:DNA primase [Halobacteriovoraceae bacterium]|tara:strand:+ start:27717 stop:29603 length:1887 start_codon:yes stop_codon:yes gene_type:complete
MASIDETIEIIRETPISSIISFYHSIRKKGANYEGLCPFHGDTKPSLVVSDQKRIYKCFACGAGGDAIKFVMEHNGLQFIDAVKEIADKIGIHVEENKKKATDPKYDMAIRVLKAANKLYRKVALERNPQNFQDFLKNRKLNEESVNDFEIGYATKNNMLVSYFDSIPNEKDKEFAIKVAVDIGIIRPSKHGGGHYDFYRDRVMFPIADQQGNVRGFSSRAVLPDQKPKYLNSGESYIFDKANILYGFHLAKRHIRKQEQVLIAEGNMDVVALHQYGFNYSVGTMGTALSENMAKMLTNMTKTIYLGMDSDPAGIKAMTRINEMFMGMGVLPKFVDYSPAKDPDDFLKEFGRIELLNRMENASPFLDYLIEKTIPVPIPETVDRKLEVLNEIFEFIAPLKEGLLAKEKAVEASKALGLKSSNEDIIEAYKAFLEGKKQKFAPKKFDKRPKPEPEQQFSRHLPEEKVFSEPDVQKDAPQELTKAEKVFLERILTHPECVQNEQILEILDLIDHFEVKGLIQWLKKIYLEIDENDYEILLQKKLEENFSRPVSDVIASAIFNHNKLKLETKIVEKLLKDFKTRAQVEKLRKKKRELTNQQRQCSTEEESFELLNKILEVEKQLRDIKYKS